MQEDGRAQAGKPGPDGSGDPPKAFHRARSLGDGTTRVRSREVARPRGFEPLAF
jgi:hypothetical protein